MLLAFQNTNWWDEQWWERNPEWYRRAWLRSISLLFLEWLQKTTKNLSDDSLSRPGFEPSTSSRITGQSAVTNQRHALPHANLSVNKKVCFVSLFIRRRRVTNRTQSYRVSAGGMRNRRPLRSSSEIYWLDIRRQHVGLVSVSWSLILNTSSVRYAQDKGFTCLRHKGV